MSLNVGSVIERVDLINVFNSVVVSTIKANAYDLNNPPMEGSNQCVKSAMMDSLSNLPTPEVGVVNGRISASSLVSALIDTTRNLTRVGTFSWVRTMHESHTVLSQYDRSGYTYGTVLYDRYYNVATKSGKVVFNSSYIRNLKTAPSSGNVVAGNPIKITDINTLCQACLTAWKNTSKYNYSYTMSDCHSSCHSNCHSSCHSSCHSACYSD